MAYGRDDGVRVVPYFIGFFQFLKLDAAAAVVRLIVDLRSRAQAAGTDSRLHLLRFRQSHIKFFVDSRDLKARVWVSC